MVNLRAAQSGIFPQSHIELRMRIAIDTHAIGSKLTGNERYIENIVEQLLRLDRENEYFLFFTLQDARRKWCDRAGNLIPTLVSQSWIRLCIDLRRNSGGSSKHLSLPIYRAAISRRPGSRNCS